MNRHFILPFLTMKKYTHKLYKYNRWTFIFQKLTFASWKLNFHRLKVELLEAKSSTFETYSSNYWISNSYKYAQTKVVLHKNTKRPVRLSLFFGINFYSFGMKVFHWKKIVCAHGKIASGKFPFFFCQNKKRLYLCTLKINLYT